MFERQERTAIFLLAVVAIMVIVAHLLLSAVGKQPFARPFSNKSADGELVVFQGQIDQVTLTKSGGNLILTINNLTVFLSGSAAQGLSCQKGDSVVVYGIVQTYRGKKEIMVESPADISVQSVK